MSGGIHLKTHRQQAQLANSAPFRLFAIDPTLFLGLTALLILAGEINLSVAPAK